MQRSISCGPRNGLGLCNERGYDSAAPLRGGPPLILLLCLTLLAAPAFAQGTLSASDATALSELASFANAELERGTRAEDPAAARNAAENKAHIDRMVGAARANDAALRAKGIVTEVAVAGILFSDLGKNAEYLDAHARKVFPALYANEATRGLAKFKAFLLHEEPGIERLRAEARRVGLSAKTTSAVVDAIVGHNGPAVEGSWWQQNWDTLIRDHEGRTSSKMVGRSYPEHRSREGALHTVFDRLDQGSLTRTANGWEGGPKKIMNDIMANTSFEAAVREALEGNPKKTLPQLEALRARHGDLFDLDVVREGEARLRRTMSLLNHVEFLDEARARVHTPDGKTVEVSSFEAFWKALAQVEEPLEDRRAWERPIEDRLLPFRRADGTVEWKRAVAARALGELGGAGHFALALFLKELAVVVRSGDRARIEEFFDHLLTTDFLKEYGLFVLGARVGDVAYTRYLERFVRPRFVSGVLRTNLVLAAGLALPMIVEGNFSGRAFAVSLSSLGLSTAAVRAGVASIRWVHELRSARGAGTLGRLGLQAKRFARVGGWFYSVGELAVILYVADEIAERINEHLDREAAEDALVAATEEFQVAVSDPSVSKESLDGATDTFRSAWSDYRNFLYRPLQQDEVVLAGRLAKLAAKAKQLEDRRNAIVSRIAVLPALSRSVLRRFASIEDYAAERLRKDEEELSQDLDVYTDSYRRAREEHLRAVYEDGVRGTPLLAGVNSTDWLFGTGAEPYAGRRDVFARVGRSRIRSSLAEAVRSASPNRLEAYGDELALLDAARHALRTRGRSELARVIESGAERTSRAWVLDRRLIQKDSGVVDTHAGAAGRLAGAGR